MAAILASLRIFPQSFRNITVHRNSFENLKIHLQFRKNYTRLVRRCLRPYQNVLDESIESRCHCQFISIPTSRRSFYSSPILRADSLVVNTPPFAESITEGDVRWEKAVGDSVTEDEVVAEIETDKTTISVPSPASGIIEELFVPDGERVEPGQKLFKLKLSGDAPAKSEPAEDAYPPESKPETPEKPPAEPETPKSAPPPAPSLAGAIPTSPPPAPPLPKGPMSSKPVSDIKVTPPVDAPKPSSTAPSSAPPAGSRGEQRIKMNRMRKRIAMRLKEAQNTCAMLTTFNEIDMSNVMEMRKIHKDSFQKKHGVKLGFMSAFIRASSHALKNQPIVNAVIDEDEIVYRDYIDISVAVATPKGLLVPVLRDVGNMNYAQIELALNELGEKARDGAIAIEDMDGGTFTISNGGVFGSMFGTPIINPPQSAILGMHAIFNRPMGIDGKVEIRPMMYVALTYDHRLIDGREAVTFLRAIKQAVEDPRTILLDL